MDLTTPIIIKLSLRLVGTRFKAIFSSSRPDKGVARAAISTSLLGTVQHEYAQMLSAVVYLCYTTLGYIRSRRFMCSCARFYPSFVTWTSLLI